MKTICFITRCHPKRPNMLRFCVDSVKSQSCKDYQHLLLHNDRTKEGYGVARANRALHTASPLRGEYIMVLDDDDFLVDNNFVAEFKEVVSKGKPDIVMFRGIVMGGGILPPDDIWGKPPQRAGIGSFCFAVRKDVWYKYIKFWVGSEGHTYMGDYTFINKCYHSVATIHWLDKLVTCTQRVSHGAGELKPRGGQHGRDYWQESIPRHQSSAE